MRIYIAGPYGDENTEEIIAKNVSIAEQTAIELIFLGHEVYCPHISCHWAKDQRITLEDCIRVDKTFIDHWAEALIRIRGRSFGSDLEVKRAIERGLTIFYDIIQVPKK